MKECSTGLSCLLLLLLLSLGCLTQSCKSHRTITTIDTLVTVTTPKDSVQTPLISIPCIELVQINGEPIHDTVFVNGKAEVQIKVVEKAIQVKGVCHPDTVIIPVKQRTEANCPKCPEPSNWWKWLCVALIGAVIVLLVKR